MSNQKFFHSADSGWEKADDGVKRKILGYDGKIMMVLVDFGKNATGKLHKHPHAQATYVLSGIFEVTINGESRILREGDSFVVPGDGMHGVLCIEKGMLLDAFSPVREDFLKGE